MDATRRKEEEEREGEGGGRGMSVRVSMQASCSLSTKRLKKPPFPGRIIKRESLIPDSIIVLFMNGCEWCVISHSLDEERQREKARNGGS